MRIAVVAAQAFDNSRIFEFAITRYGPNMIVFNTVSTACKWLGIESVTAEHAIDELRAQARKITSG